MYPIINKEEMENLINRLNEATKAYDKGNPIMTDKEWDDLYFKLVALEEEGRCYLPNSPTRKIIYEVKNKLSKIEHNHPMLSLNKTKNIEEVISFISNKEYIAMEKMDGLTCSLRYLNGKLASAETRGDGKIGEDILHNVLLLDSVPKAITYKEELIIDGEIICDLETFEKNFSKEYKNPRNYAAGAIRRLDSRENKSCGLTFVAWDVIKGFDEYKTLSKKLNKLVSYNFTAVDYSSTGDIEKDIKIIKHSAETYDFPIDGIVFKYDNIEYYQSLGSTDHHFRGGLAYKFYDEEYETRLKYIEWSLGRTGVLTPIAVFEPVEIDSTTVEKASLHNYSTMKEIMGDCCYCGQKIKVYKANMIIPQIKSAVKMSYGDVISRGGITCDGFSNDYGVRCPVCEGSTSLVASVSGTVSLVCDNPNCEGKIINKLDHFCSKKGLDIKGLSKATLEKLVDWGWLNNVKDLYNLDAHKKEWVGKPGFGEKSVQKIIDAIEDSKTCQWSTFVSALGIPLIGTTVSKELTKYFTEYKGLRNYIIDGGSFLSFDGFGPEMDKSLKEFDYTEADEIAEMLTFKQPEALTKEEKSKTIEGLVFCITGKLSKARNLIQADIEASGGKVGGSVTGKTNYLVCNKPEASAKYKAAVDKGLPIITEEELYKML